MNNEYIPKSVRIAVVALVVVATIFLAVKTVSAFRGWSKDSASTDAKPSITVSGKGEAFAVPDIATFTFTVTEEGKTIKDAQPKATEKINKAIDYLKKAGIAEKDIKTVSYNAYPRYEYQQITCVRYPCPSGRQVLLGYEVSQTIEVKVRDTAKAGELLSGVGALNVDNVSGLNFEVDDEDAVMRQARQKAIADAKSKAEMLAKDLGVRLVRIVSFEESGTPTPIYYSKAMAADGRGGAEAAPPPQVPTGENKVTLNVVITYEIR